MRIGSGSRAAAASAVTSVLTSVLTSAAVLALARLAGAGGREEAVAVTPPAAPPAAPAPAPAGPDAAGGKTVGDAANALTVAQLDAERARKASLEARGITVITSSGTLVTLLLALGAISAKVDSVKLSPATVGVVLAALACFVVAAVAGILCNAPRAYAGVKTYTRADDKDFASGTVDLGGQEPGLDYYLVEEHYWLPVREVERRFAVYRVAELDDARAANDGKAQALAVGIVAEVAAVVGVSAAVGLILYGRL